MAQRTKPLTFAITARTKPSILACWPFSSPASRLRFLDSDISSLTCRLFPSAIEDRIYVAASLLSLLHLLDDDLAELSVDEGEEFLEYLRTAVGGSWEEEEEEVEEQQPAVCLLGGVLDELRGFDYEVGGEVVAAMWEWLRIRNVKRRGRGNSPDHMGDLYQSIVETDLRWYLMRFVMDVRVDEDLEGLGLVRPKNETGDEIARGRTRRRRCEKGFNLLKKAPVVTESEIVGIDLSPV